MNASLLLFFTVIVSLPLAATAKAPAKVTFIETTATREALTTNGDPEKDVLLVHVPGASHAAVDKLREHGSRVPRGHALVPPGVRHIRHLTVVGRRHVRRLPVVAWQVDTENFVLEAVIRSKRAIHGLVPKQTTVGRFRYKGTRLQTRQAVPTPAPIVSALLPQLGARTRHKVATDKGWRAGVFKGLTTEHVTLFSARFGAVKGRKIRWLAAIASPEGAPGGDPDIEQSTALAFVDGKGRVVEWVVEPATRLTWFEFEGTVVDDDGDGVFAAYVGYRYYEGYHTHLVEPGGRSTQLSGGGQ